MLAVPSAGLGVGEDALWGCRVPDSAAVQDQLVQTYVWLGRTEEAIDAYRALLQMGPADAAAQSSFESLAEDPHRRPAGERAGTRGDPWPGVPTAGTA